MSHKSCDMGIHEFTPSTFQKNENELIKNAYDFNYPVSVASGKAERLHLIGNEDIILETVKKSGFKKRNH